MKSSTLPMPAVPLSEVAAPLVPASVDAYAIPTPRSTTAHAAGPELVMAGTSARLCLSQLRHAAGRDQWSQETANLGGELEVNLLTIIEALDALAHRAATYGGQAL